MQQFTKNDLEILIATQNRSNLTFLEQMFPFQQLSELSILIINQTTKDNILRSDYENIRVINSFEKGLSKSRNLALQNASKKIGLIADDDIIYKENFQDIVIQSFTKFPKSAVIRLMYESNAGNLANSYPKKSKNNLHWFDILNTASVEMIVNLEIVAQKSIKFDENFGLNSRFPMGEEAIFLSDCRTKKLPLAFYPAVICQHPSISTHQKIATTERYTILGAIFTRIFKKWALFWVFIKLFFDVKHKNITFYQVFTLLKQVKYGQSAYNKLSK